MVGVLALNLSLFILITSLPVFQAAHHHWIFSVLAVVFSLQYLTLRYFGRPRWAGAASAETTLLTLLAFLPALGIVRHLSILTCFGQCGFKLSGASAITAWAFLLHGSEPRPGFWDPVRCRLLSAGAFFWSLYLALLSFGFTPWVLDVLFFVFSLLFWLGRGHGLFFTIALGILTAGAIRMTGSELLIIFLNLGWVAALLLGGGHRIEAWIENKVPPSGTAPAQEPLARRLIMSVLRISAAVSVIAGLGFYAAGSISFVTDPAARRKKLLSDAAHSAVQDAAALSPLAKRLHAHVFFLADTIGSRAAHQTEKQLGARDYVADSLRAMGYEPSILRYGSKWMARYKQDSPFYNVLAVRRGETKEVLVVGAHYDSSTDTPGADDNASGVAVLLEAARLLHEKKPRLEIHFVGFGTEEPPAFGTQNMGSSHYAKRLKEGGAKVHGMLSLEMLGYYNPKKGSQLYPPFMHLFYPSHGDYISLVGNWNSRSLLQRFTKGWRTFSGFQIEGALLPGPLSALALSDQLNFWAEGYPALMLSDTAFYRNPHYHQHSDSPSTLDYEKMALVTQGLVAVLEELR